LSKKSEKYVNSDYLQSVPSLVKKLSPLEVQALELQEQTAQQYADLETLLSSYNDIIRMISEKFVYWDSLLTTWEKGLDKMKSKGHHKG